MRSTLHPTMSTSGFYSERLDHLRFFAALFVMWWHLSAELKIPDPKAVPDFPFWSLFDEGHVGVSLFFCLSGYLFYTISADRTIAYGGFIFNRILRIGPLIIFWTVFDISVGTRIPAVEVVLAILTTFGSLPGVGWSLIIEMQFYLLFPFLLRFTRERGVYYLVGLVALMFVLRTIVWLYGGHIRNIGYNTIFGHFDQFLIGMVVAHWIKNRTAHFGQYAAYLLIGLAVAVASTHYLNEIGGWRETEDSPVWIWFPTAQAVGWSLLIAGYANITGIPRIPVLTAALARLGEWSYSIYWCHITVMAGVRGLMAYHVFKAPTTVHGMVNLFVFIAVPCTVAFAAASFYLTEKPFMDMRKSYSAKIGTAARPVPASAA